MCIWIIHAKRVQLQCLIHTSLRHYISFCTIDIASADSLIIFVLDIYNAFQNIILLNTEERVYISLPHLYLEWFKIKCPKIHWHQEIKKNSALNPSNVKLCYDLLKYIFIKAKMIKFSSDHAIFSFICKTYTYFLSVETDDIKMGKQNRIFFERLIK